MLTMISVKYISSHYRRSVFMMTGLLMLFSSCMGQTNFEDQVNSMLNGTVEQVRENDLLKMIDSTSKPILLDARTAEEYKVSHIKGAKFIDYDDFEPEMVDGINKDTPVVVYCSIGYRSEKIGEQLKEMGYTNVLNLHGGIFDWKNKGHEVVNDKGIKTDSVHTYNKSWSKWLIEGIKVYE